MPIRSHFLPEANLNIKLLGPDVTLEQVKDSKIEERAAGILDRDLKTLVILTGAKISLSTEDVKAYVYWLRDFMPEMHGAKTAILASAPVATALSLLFSEFAEGVQFVETFSTMEAALDWLGTELTIVRTQWPDSARYVMMT